MAKQSGLGDNFYVGGYDLSGDVNSISKISGPIALLDFTTVNQKAYSRQGGLRSGEMSFTTFMDPANNFSHSALKTLPRADTLVSYFRGTALGNPTANLFAKQIGYDPTRGTDGSLTLAVDAQSNAFGLEWGEQLTAGLRTDTSATAGPFVDDGAATSFGGQAYLQVTAFTGTDVTIAIQHATTSGGSYSNVLAFAQTTAANTFQRISVSNTTTINEFVKVTTTTSGGFTSVTFAVGFTRNKVAGQVF